MDINKPLDLLGGLTPRAFMRRYWQRRPLLIRQAIPNYVPALSITDIRRLVRREEVESRLIWHDSQGWHMKHGPMSRLPAMNKPQWTVLAQSVDLHDDRMAALMHRFRFIADARLDDIMISIASDGGGVGPHFDSYDVFLLQAHGRRRWRISRQRDLSLEPDLPLKILRNFQPQEEYVLEPGDMLYLPPHVAHDGVAEGDCMTISIGFRAPTQAALACGMLEAANDQIMANLGDTGGLYGSPVIPGAILSATYKDRGISATANPAALPQRLIDATLAAASKIRYDEALASRFLGVWLTEPPAGAIFEPSDDTAQAILSEGLPREGSLILDRCTRMMYRKRQLFINGETAPVPASAAMRRLADRRVLECAHRLARHLTTEECNTLARWLEDGWLHYHPA